MDGQTDEPDQEPPMNVMREKRDDGLIDRFTRALNGVLSQYRSEIKDLERQVDNMTLAREVERDRYHELKNKIKELAK